MRKKPKIVFETGDRNLQVIFNKKSQERRIAPSSCENINRPNKKIEKITEKQEVESIKIKTLAEIRAERTAKLDKLKQEKEEAEVTSTSKEEIPVTESMNVDEPEQIISTSCSSIPHVRKIRLRRKVPIPEDVMSSSTSSATDVNHSDTNPNEISERRFRSLKDEGGNYKVTSESNVEEKMLDDVLLLEEDDDEYDITLKAEEDLLNDIDEDD